MYLLLLQRTATTCIQQAQSAAHYLPLTVIPSRLDSGTTSQVPTHIILRSDRNHMLLHSAKFDVMRQ